MGLPVYLSRFRVVAGSWEVSVTIGVTTELLAVAAGRYYNDAFVAGDSFAAALQNALNTHSALGGNSFSVTYDLAAGEFTISRAANFNLTWTVTALRDWLGFSGNVSGGASYTSDQVAQGTILAGSDRQKWPGLESDIPNADGSSSSGVTSGVGSTNEIWTGSWLHGFELQAGAASPLESGTRDDASAVVPWVWFDFFRHHRTYRHPFRYYPDRDLTVNDYEHEYVLRAGSLGPFAPDNQEEADWYYWRVPVEVQRYRAP